MMHSSITISNVFPSNDPVPSEAPLATPTLAGAVENDLEPTDVTVEMKRIVVTLKTQKIVFAKREDGSWSELKKKRPNFLGRHVSLRRRRMYADALKRKKKRASTAFERLRRKNIREMHSRSFRKVDSNIRTSI